MVVYVGGGLRGEVSVCVCVCAWMWRCDGHGRVDISNPPNPLNILIDCDLFGSCQRDAYPVRRRSSLDLHFDTAIEAARGGFASAPTARSLLRQSTIPERHLMERPGCCKGYDHPIELFMIDFTSVCMFFGGGTGKFARIDVIRKDCRPISPYSLMQDPFQRAPP